MERDFLEWFGQSVTVEPWVRDDQYGQPVYGAPVSYSARVQEKVKMIRDTQGQQVVSTSQVYFDGSVTVTVKDRITLPDGTQPLILSIGGSPDETGVIDHRVVYT